MEVCRKCVGSVVIGTKVLGSSGDKNELEDEESESFPTSFKTVYKIFKNFQINPYLGDFGNWASVISGQKIQREFLYTDLGIFWKIVFYIWYNDIELGN